jgi:hypothetical protein
MQLHSPTHAAHPSTLVLLHIRVRLLFMPAGAARVKKAEQMSDDELKQALPSMLFTTSNLIWSSE